MAVAGFKNTFTTTKVGRILKVLLDQPKCFASQFYPIDEEIFGLTSDQIQVRII